MRSALAFLFLLSLAATGRAQSLFGAELDAASVVPPTNSKAGAYASFELDASGALVYSVKSWLVAGTSASIHVGAAGGIGPVLATLSGGPSVWSGTTAAL